MAEDDQRDPEVELARLNEERRLMEQLVEFRGWKHLVSVIEETVGLLRKQRDSVFLQVTFGENKLDGIQSLVYEGYEKGIRAGMIQVLNVPINLITHNADAAKLEQLKINRKEENQNGSSTNGSSGDDSSDDHDFDSESIAERSAP